MFFYMICAEPTLEKYMANYEPAPITKHLSKQENESNDSLGKWFPKATVIKSSVCYSNDYLVSLKKKSKQSEDVQEPKASLVLFYQYVNPVWTPMKVSALSGYITNIVKSYRTNLGGRMRISSEGVNCTVSAASSASSTDAAFEAAQTLRHFAQDLRNFDPDSFSDTDFKYIDNLTADRHFKEMKILPVKELVFYGIREDGGANHEDIKTEGEVSHVLPKNAKGGIHLDAHEYHDMLKTKNTVVIDVRNHYEAAIGRFDGQMESNADDADGGNGERNSGAQYIDPKMRKSTDFTSWLEEPETKQKLEGKTVMMFCTGEFVCYNASWVCSANSQIVTTCVINN
jgi:predicted sulfurtransferase